MATFKFTTALTQTGFGAVMGNVTNSIGGTTSGGGLSFMNIYSTAMPNLASIATLTKAGLPTPLVSFSLANRGSISGQVASLTSLPSATATATGTAVWFAMYNNNDESIIVGDISTLVANTGAVLLNDTAIVSGQLYQMQNISVIFPNAYTY